MTLFAVNEILTAARLNTLPEVDASGVMITPAVGVSRSAASRALDLPNFADSGAVGNGIADDTAVLQTWLIAVQAARGPSLVYMDGRVYLINSADLIIPQGIIIIGPWLTGRGENTPTFDYTTLGASFIVNPAYTVRLGHSSGIVGAIVRRKGLLPGTTLANLVANHMGRAGTGITIGVSGGTGPVGADDTLVERNFVLGFSRGIDSVGNRRIRIRDNKIHCHNGIRVQVCQDWMEVSGNQVWDFEVGDNPIFNSNRIPIASSSIVGSKRRFITSSPHPFVTGWPVLITSGHAGAGIAPCYGVAPVTVLNGTTFDLETSTPLTAVISQPSGPGAGVGAGGYALPGIIVNYGVAYEFSNVVDWGVSRNNAAWGSAIGHLIADCDNATLLQDAIDNYSDLGWWGAVGISKTGTSGMLTCTACQIAGVTTAVAVSGAGSEGNRITLTGCQAWNIQTNFLNLQAGSVALVGGNYEDTGGTGAAFQVGASAVQAEFVGVQGGAPIRNLTGNINAVKITGGDWGYNTVPTVSYATAGTTQSTATPISAPVAYIQTASAPQGVVLAPGVQTTICNMTNTSFYVYPPVGSQFGSGATDTPVVHPAAASGGTASVTYTPLSLTVWALSGGGAASGTSGGPYLAADVAAATYAPIKSPIFQGNPQLASTPSAGDSDQSIANTGFVSAALATALGVGTGTGGSTTGVAIGSGPGGNLIRAQSLADTLGIHVKFEDGGWYSGSPYGNLTLIQNAMSYLNPRGVGTGVGIIRYTPYYAGGSYPVSTLTTLAGQGYKFSAFGGFAPGAVGWNGGNQWSLIKTTPALLAATVYVEGMLEVDGFGFTDSVTYTPNGGGGSYTGWAAVVHSQIDIWNYFNGSGPQVMLWSLANPANGSGSGAAVSAASAAGITIGAICNLGNVHCYPGRGYPAKVQLASTIASETGYTSGKPFGVTEIGFQYSTDGTGAASGYYGTPEANAPYTLQAVLDCFSQGSNPTLLYQLFDENANYTGPGAYQDHFGIFDKNGLPKLAAVQLHNMLYVLGDAGATRSTFFPGSMTVTVTGLPANGGYLKGQKSNGDSWIVLWPNAQLLQTDTNTAQTPPSVNVTVGLGATYSAVSVYDPASGASSYVGVGNFLTATPAPTPISGPVSASSIVVTLTSGPKIIYISAGGSGATSGKLGFYGHAPVAQPAAPVTLADVIAIIRGVGLSA